MQLTVKNSGPFRIVYAFTINTFLKLVHGYNISLHCAQLINKLVICGCFTQAVLHPNFRTYIQLCMIENMNAYM